MRLFIGVKPSYENLKDLVALQQEFRKLHGVSAKGRNCRWTNTDHIHLTLHFLGQVGAVQTDALRQALGGRILGRSLNQRLDIPVAFPKPSHARIGGIGAGISDSMLVSIHKKLGSIIESIGLPAEDRAFVPHITLVRFREPVALDRDELGRWINRPVEFQIQNIALYESVQGPAGLNYRIIEEFPLATAHKP